MTNIHTKKKKKKIFSDRGTSSAAGASFLGVRSRNNPYENLGERLHGSYAEGANVRRCEVEAPYEHEIATLQGIESDDEWNRFWEQERQVRRTSAVQRVSASPAQVQASVDQAQRLERDGQSRIEEAAGSSGETAGSSGDGASEGEGDAGEVDHFKSTALSGPEVEIVPGYLCRRTPLKMHAYRTVVIERCLGAGEGPPAITQFKTPTPQSECGMRVTHRFHDTADGRDTQGMISVSDYDDRVFVTFRASDSTQDWANVNLRLIQTRETVGGVDLGRVHRGFHRAAVAVRPRILAALAPHLAAGRKITYVGHSLGGALATVLALHTRIMHPQSRVSLVTYGSPRVGDRRFARLFDEQVSESIRIVATFPCKGRTYADAVATVPPKSGTQAADASGALLATGSALSKSALSGSELSKSALSKSALSGSALSKSALSGSVLTKSSDVLASTEWDAWDRARAAAAEKLRAARERLNTAGDNIRAGWDRTKRTVKSAGASVAHRVAVAGVAAVTEYEHVGGLELMPVKIHGSAVCADHLAALKFGMSVHGAYRRELLYFQLDEFLITEGRVASHHP
jgi:pimeloyl-ACP methyl ester carboxylesterase